MKLNDLTKEYIRIISNPITFDIGEGYYESGRVSDLKYDKATTIVTAAVPSMTGEHKYYYVKVFEENGELKAKCDCLQNGYPCKHTVAVMLGIAESNTKYSEGDWGDTLRATLDKLSKSELVEMVVGCAHKYPDFKDELMATFSGNGQETIENIREQIEKVFSNSGESSPQIISGLKSIAELGNTVSNATKAEIYWAIADRILEEQNKKGIGDKSLAEAAVNYIRNLAFLLKGDDSDSKARRQEILKKLTEYYEQDKCGIGDSIYTAARSFLKDKDDYQIVIDCMERMVAPAYAGANHRRWLLADLYKETGEEEARLRTLESDLKYATDYYQLAQYWVDKNQTDKALEVMKAGIEIGEGRKDELYSYMQKHYESRNDFDDILELLKSKIQDGQFKYHNLESDETYRCLKKRYDSMNDYSGKVKLLNLRLTDENLVDLKLYKEAKETLKASDWANFEKGFIAQIKKKRVLS